MEVSLLESEGLPEGCLLSIRAGTTRRQAPVERNLRLAFPKGIQHAEPFKVDALAPLGGAVLSLESGIERYDLPLENGEGSTLMRVSLLIRDVTHVSGVGQPGVEASAFAGFPLAEKPEGSGGSSGSTARRHRAALSARRYLDEHKLLQWAQVLFQDLIREQPEDPWVYIDEQSRKAQKERSAEKGVQKPEADVHEPGCVSSRIRLTNVDYAQLSARPTLLAAFQGAVKQAIVADLGQGLLAEDVKLALAAGSVVILATITPRAGSGASVDSIRSKLGSSTTIASAVANKVSTLPGMDAVCHGEITVGEVCLLTPECPPPKATLPAAMEPALSQQLPKQVTDVEAVRRRCLGVLEEAAKGGCPALVVRETADEADMSTPDVEGLRRRFKTTLASRDGSLDDVLQHPAAPALKAADRDRRKAATPSQSGVLAAILARRTPLAPAAREAGHTPSRPGDTQIQQLRCKAHGALSMAAETGMLEPAVAAAMTPAQASSAMPGVGKVEAAEAGKARPQALGEQQALPVILGAEALRRATGAKLREASQNGALAVVLSSLRPQVQEAEKEERLTSLGGNPDVEALRKATSAKLLEASENGALSSALSRLVPKSQAPAAEVPPPGPNNAALQRAASESARTETLRVAASAKLQEASGNGTLATALASLRSKALPEASASAAPEVSALRRATGATLKEASENGTLITVLQSLAPGSEVSGAGGAAAKQAPPDAGSASSKESPLVGPDAGALRRAASAKLREACESGALTGILKSLTRTWEETPASLREVAAAKLQEASENGTLTNILSNLMAGNHGHHGNHGCQALLEMPGESAVGVPGTVLLYDAAAKATKAGKLDINTIRRTVRATLEKASQDGSLALELQRNHSCKADTHALKVTLREVLESGCENGSLAAALERAALPKDDYKKGNEVCNDGLDTLRRTAHQSLMKASSDSTLHKLLEKPKRCNTEMTDRFETVKEEPLLEEEEELRRMARNLLEQANCDGTLLAALDQLPQQVPPTPQSAKVQVDKELDLDVLKLQLREALSQAGRGGALAAALAKHVSMGASGACKEPGEVEQVRPPGTEAAEADAQSLTMQESPDSVERVRNMVRATLAKASQDGSLAEARKQDPGSEGLPQSRPIERPQSPAAKQEPGDMEQSRSLAREALVKATQDGTLAEVLYMEKQQSQEVEDAEELEAARIQVRELLARASEDGSLAEVLQTEESPPQDAPLAEVLHTGRGSHEEVVVQPELQPGSEQWPVVDSDSAPALACHWRSSAGCAEVQTVRRAAWVRMLKAKRDGSLVTAIQHCREPKELPLAHAGDMGVGALKHQGETDNLQTALLDNQEEPVGIEALRSELRDALAEACQDGSLAAELACLREENGVQEDSAGIEGLRSELRATLAEACLDGSLAAELGMLQQSAVQMSEDNPAQFGQNNLQESAGIEALRAELGETLAESCRDGSLADELKALRVQEDAAGIEAARVELGTALAEACRDGALADELSALSRSATQEKLGRLRPNGLEEESAGIEAARVELGAALAEACRDGSLADELDALSRSATQEKFGTLRPNGLQEELGIEDLRSRAWQALAQSLVDGSLATALGESHEEELGFHDSLALTTHSLALTQQTFGEVSQATLDWELSDDRLSVLERGEHGSVEALRQQAVTRTLTEPKDVGVLPVEALAKDPPSKVEEDLQDASPLVAKLAAQTALETLIKNELPAQLQIDSEELKTAKMKAQDALMRAFQVRAASGGQLRDFTTEEISLAKRKAQEALMKAMKIKLAQQEEACSEECTKDAAAEVLGVEFQDDAPPPAVPEFGKEVPLSAAEKMPEQAKASRVPQHMEENLVATLKTTPLEVEALVVQEVEEAADTAPLAKEVALASVATSLTVKNLDYDVLLARPSLLASFQSATKEALAMEAGAGILPEHVSLELSKGSVQVLATITPPSGVSVGDVSSKLKASSSLTEALASKVKSVEGIHEVATGTICVGDVSVSEVSTDIEAELKEKSVDLVRLRAKTFALLQDAARSGLLNSAMSVSREQQSHTHREDVKVPESSLHPDCKMLMEQSKQAILRADREGSLAAALREVQEAVSNTEDDGLDDFGEDAAWHDADAGEAPQLSSAEEETANLWYVESQQSWEMGGKHCMLSCMACADGERLRFEILKPSRDMVTITCSRQQFKEVQDEQPPNLEGPARVSAAIHQLFQEGLDEWREHDRAPEECLKWSSRGGDSDPAGEENEKPADVGEHTEAPTMVTTLEEAEKLAAASEPREGLATLRRIHFPIAGHPPGSQVPAMLHTPNEVEMLAVACEPRGEVPASVTTLEEAEKLAVAPEVREVCLEETEKPAAAAKLREVRSALITLEEVEKLAVAAEPREEEHPTSPPIAASPDITAAKATVSVTTTSRSPPRSPKASSPKASPPRSPKADNLKVLEDRIRQRNDRFRRENDALRHENGRLKKLRECSEAAAKLGAANDKMRKDLRTQLANTGLVRSQSGSLGRSHSGLGRSPSNKLVAGR